MRYWAIQCRRKRRRIRKKKRNMTKKRREVGKSKRGNERMGGKKEHREKIRETHEDDVEEEENKD